MTGRFNDRTAKVAITPLCVVLFLGAMMLPGLAQDATALDVTLTWDANSESDLAGYRVFHRESGQAYNYNSPSWQGVSTTCTIPGLDEDTTYYFVARAYDTSENESADSDEVAYAPTGIYSLLISSASDRSDPVPLNGQTVSGNIYVFTDPDDGVVHVQFYLDDPTMSGDPYRVENAVRYDFAATAGDGSANPFDTTTLSNGTHQITAHIQETTGSTYTLQGSFVVSNGVSPTLSGLSVAGSSSVNENTTSSYTATATYSNGSTQTVTTSASWSENSSYASINGSGVLTASSVATNQTVIITASYTDGGVTQVDQLTVTIVDTSPTLAALAITGSNSVNENTTSSYTATATYSNGSTQTVTTSASWSENSSYASINGSGVLSALEVTDDTTLIISATYSEGGVTRSAQKTVSIVNIPETNLAPNKPVISAPYDGQTDCDLVFEAETEAFSDPNGDAHVRSQWQISKASNFSSSVMDATSTVHLTGFTIPHTLLENDTTYFMRVRFYDVYLEPSVWSDGVSFTTTQDTNDMDDDGIPDNQEVGPGVDLDGNGIDDVDEPENIKSVQSEDGLTTLGVAKESDTVVSIDAVELIDPQTIPDTDNRPATLTGSLLSYRITVNSAGATAYITVYYASEIPSGASFYKYDTIHGWSNYGAHTTFNGDGRSITLEIQDGGHGDTDGQANGVIVDPGGLGSGDSGDSVSTSSLESIGDSSGGGCFIAMASSATPGEFKGSETNDALLLFFSAFLGAIGLTWRQKSRRISR